MRARTRHPRAGGDPVIKNFRKADNIKILSALRVVCFAGFPPAREWRGQHQL